MSLFVQIEDTVQDIFEAVKARILANRQQMGRGARGMTRPRAQRTRFNATMANYRPPEPSASRGGGVFFDWFDPGNADGAIQTRNGATYYDPAWDEYLADYLAWEPTPNPVPPGLPPGYIQAGESGEFRLDRGYVFPLSTQRNSGSCVYALDRQYAQFSWSQWTAPSYFGGLPQYAPVYSEIILQPRQHTYLITRDTVTPIDRPVGVEALMATWRPVFDSFTYPNSADPYWDGGGVFSWSAFRAAFKTETTGYEEYTEDDPNGSRRNQMQRASYFTTVAVGAISPAVYSAMRTPEPYLFPEPMAFDTVGAIMPDFLNNGPIYGQERATIEGVESWRFFEWRGARPVTFEDAAELGPSTPEWETRKPVTEWEPLPADGRILFTTLNRDSYCRANIYGAAP